MHRTTRGGAGKKVLWIILAAVWCWPGVCGAQVSYEVSAVLESQAGAALGTPSINNRGQMAWTGDSGQGQSIFFSYHGVTSAVATTEAGAEFSDADLNHAGQTIWTQYRWGRDPQAIITLYDNGNIFPIIYSSGDTWYGAPSINTPGQIVYKQWSPDSETGENYQTIYMWNNGPTTTIVQGTPGGLSFGRPDINDQGQVAWVQMEPEETGTSYTMYLWDDGVATAIIEAPAGATYGDPCLNDLGQMVWLMTETENDTVTTSLLLYDFDLSEVSMVFQNNQPAETWLSPRLNDYNQIVYTRKAFLTTGEGTQDSFAVMLANPYYEGYSAYELSNGQRYLAYSRLSPVWSYIYAVPEANPEEYTMWAVVPLDRQISTDLYFFYYTDFSGNAYQGFIYNDYIYDYGYFAGAAVNDPLLAFQGYYSQVAEGTYDYIFQSPSGEVFTGQGLLTSMLGQFYGVSIDQGGYFVSLSQMLQTPVGHLSLANFWGNVLGACLLEYEEGETP